MLDKTIAYHLDQLRQNQLVLDTDGNIYSDAHRAAARREIDIHNAIIAELDAVNEPLEPFPALDVIVGMHVDHTARILRLERLEDAAGPGISRQMMLQEIKVMEPQRDALAVAMLALRDVASRRAFTHLKRGSHYDEYGRGILQTDFPLKDNAPIVIYRDRATRAWYARTPAEFEDGRFVAFDPVSGDAVTPQIAEPRQVLVKIEGLDDRKWAFTADEIEQIELGLPFRFDSDMTDDEDIWGAYKAVETTYDTLGLVSLRLRML